jgi:hypothetical protein
MDTPERLLGRVIRRLQFDRPPVGDLGLLESALLEVAVP